MFILYSIKISYKTQNVFIAFYRFILSVFDLFSFCWYLWYDVHIKHFVFHFHFIII